MIKNEIIEVGASKWKIREAASYDDAMHAISMACVTGSVGSKHMLNDSVVADVVRLNADGSERKPN